MILICEETIALYATRFKACNLSWDSYAIKAAVYIFLSEGKFKWAIHIDWFPQQCSLQFLSGSTSQPLSQPIIWIKRRSCLFVRPMENRGVFRKLAWKMAPFYTSGVEIKQCSIKCKAKNFQILHKTVTNTSLPSFPVDQKAQSANGR